MSEICRCTEYVTCSVCLAPSTSAGTTGPHEADAPAPGTDPAAGHSAEPAGVGGDIPGPPARSRDHAWLLGEAPPDVEASGVGGVPCWTCGEPVERAREVYAIPTCYACLPPPEPLPVAKLSSSASPGPGGRAPASAGDLDADELWSLRRERDALRLRAITAEQERDAALDEASALRLRVERLQRDTVSPVDLSSLVRRVEALERLNDPPA